MKYRRFAMVCLSALLVVGVSACSGDDGDDGNGNGDLQDAGPTDTVSPDVEQPDPDTSSDTMQPDVEPDVMMGCNLFTNAGCPDGNNCYPANQGDNVCRQYSSGNGEGSSCGGVGGCGENLYCNNGACRTRCNPDGDPGCDSDETCIGFSNLDGFGVCRPNCDLYPEDSCGDGQKCFPFTNGNQCIDFNSDKMLGDSCDPNSDPCAEEQACLPNQNSSGNSCRAFCDPSQADPCSEGTSCVSIGSTGASACVPTQN
jgi:hypothetical protein